MIPIFFVYGTLRPGCNNAMQRLLQRRAAYIGRARTSGALYRVHPNYPGLVLNTGANRAGVLGDDEQVVGDVYRITDSALIHKLDEYEGCARHCPRPHEYVRQQVFVRLDASSECVEAWTYVYQRNVQRFRRISSGDFLNQG